MPFSKETAIICIGKLYDESSASIFPHASHSFPPSAFEGHLPEHINRKVELLSEAGYKNPIPVVTRDTTPGDIKSLLKTHADDGLFLVGGAMRATYVDLMADLDAFIAQEVPQLRVHNVTKADFPPDVTWPPTSEVLGIGAVAVADRLLAEDQK